MACTFTESSSHSCPDAGQTEVDDYAETEKPDDLPHRSFWTLPELRPEWLSLQRVPSLDHEGASILQPHLRESLTDLHVAFPLVLSNFDVALTYFDLRSQSRSFE